MSRENLLRFINLIPPARPVSNPRGVYVYALSAMDEPNVIRYIGASKRCLVDRVRQHIDSARHAKDRRVKTPVVAWVRSVIQRDVQLGVRLLDHCIREDTSIVQGSNATELRWIAFFCPLFELTNNEAIRRRAGKHSTLDRLVWPRYY